MNHLFQSGLVIRYTAASWQFAFKEGSTLYFKSPPSRVTMFMAEDYFFEELRRDRLVIVRLANVDARPHFKSIPPTLTDTSVTYISDSLNERIVRRQQYIDAALSHLNGSRKQVPFSLLPTLIAHELGEPNDAPSARTLRRWLDAHFQERRHITSSLIEASALFASLRPHRGPVESRGQPPFRGSPDDTASDDD